MEFKPAIHLGTPASSADGRRLGIVAEFADTAVRILDGTADYWLPFRNIADADERGLRFDFPIEELERHLIPRRMTGPRAS